MKHLLLAATAAFALSGCSHFGGNHDNTPAPVIDAEAPDGAIRAVPMPSAPLDQSKTLTRIVFASCADSRRDQSIWDVIAGEGQDLTLFIGDNVYGDVRSNDPSLPELKSAYMRLSESEPFSSARAAAPMLTVWDDHDMGLNDGGADFAWREQSQALFNYVWAVPEGDLRRERPGLYNAWTFGNEDGKRVQIIMVDTRYFRSDLKPTDEFGAPGKERWLPDDDPAKTMLGEAQWNWLAEELKKPADLRLLVSSIQVLSEGHGWEAWREFPLERQKLYDLIKAADAKDVIVLSGDRHSAALYERDDVLDYPLVEATSSSLNLPVRGFLRPGQEFTPDDDPYRLGDMIIDANYGVVEIDWDAGSIDLVIKGADGEEIASKEVALSTLQ